MNRLFTILLAFILPSCICPKIYKAPKQNQKAETTILSQKTISTSSRFVQTNIYNQEYEDTFFILRELTKDCYHAVFIEKDRDSKYYHWLTDFKFDKYDNEGFFDNCKALKEKSAIIKKFDTYHLPSEWLPLYRYKDKYYLYAPSDWGNAGRRIITDSLLIYWYMDGPYPYVINSFEKINQNQYKIISKDYFNNEDVIVKPEELLIHIIDEKNEIAVWEYIGNKVEDYRFRLFVGKDKAKNFDIIVNHCDQMKQMEYEFDKIDFIKLIKHRFSQSPKKT